MAKACTAAFEKSKDQDLSLPRMSLLFAYGAKVEPKYLTTLASERGLEDLKELFIGGLTLVDNPFIQGVRCAFEKQKKKHY